MTSDDEKEEIQVVKIPAKFLQDVMTAVTIAMICATPGAFFWLAMMEWRLEEVEKELEQEQESTKVLTSIESRLSVLERATQDIEKSIDRLPQQEPVRSRRSEVP